MSLRYARNYKSPLHQTENLTYDDASVTSSGEFELKGLAFAGPLEAELLYDLQGTDGSSDEYSGEKEEMSSGQPISPSPVHNNGNNSHWTFFENVWSSPGSSSSSRKQIVFDELELDSLEGEDVDDDRTAVKAGMASFLFQNRDLELSSCGNCRVDLAPPTESVAPATEATHESESSNVRAVFVSMLGEAHLHEHTIIHDKADRDVERQILATNMIPVKYEDTDESTYNSSNNRAFGTKKKAAFIVKRLCCFGCILLLAGIALMGSFLVRHSGRSSIEGPSDEQGTADDSPTIAPDPQGSDITQTSYDGLNDACSRSMLVADRQALFGSTVNVPNQEDESDLPTCGGVLDNGSTGLWYKVVGDNQVWTVSTCQPQDSSGSDYGTLDSQISIFQGLCDQLVCIAGEDQYMAPYLPCGKQAQTSWYADAGTEYYVRVHGYRSSEGDFRLSLLRSASQLENDNSRCDQAHNAGRLVTELGSARLFQTFDSTQSLAGQTIGDGLTSCSVSNTVGRWYTFQSDRTTGITISTCSYRTNYAALLSVFHVVDDTVIDNETCGSLKCAEVTESVTCPSGGNVVRLAGKKPATYYILVHGSSDAKLGAGEFDLTIQADFGFFDDGNTTCPEYGRAPVSSWISVPTTTTSTSTTTTIPPSCTTSSSAGYQTEVVGTGSIITLSTCNENTNYDAPISVFEGETCNALNCVLDITEEKCNDGELGSSVSFKSTFQTRYVAVVHDGEVDGFNSILSTRGTAEVAQPFGACDSSQLVTVDDDNPTLGILVEPRGIMGANGVESLTGTCGSSSYDTRRPHAWYQVAGTGQVLTAHLCDSMTNFDTQITVFAGQCGSLFCVNGSDQSCGDVSWQTQEQEMYYILVHGYASRTGVFALHVVSE
jgi:hypothetical protein